MVCASERTAELDIEQVFGLFSTHIEHPF